MIIPTELIERWQTRARRGALQKLKSLLEFRELIPEYKSENVLMQAYKEAAVAMLISYETLRDDIGKIREYHQDLLIYWIENGVSFDHMETANRLAELAKKTPVKLLNECIDPGGENGTMTVSELTTFALGEVPKTNRREMYSFSLIYKRLGNFPTQYNWELEKAERFKIWLDAGKMFFNEHNRPDD